MTKLFDDDKPEAPRIPPSRAVPASKLIDDNEFIESKHEVMRLIEAGASDEEAHRTAVEAHKAKVAKLAQERGTAAESTPASVATEAPELEQPPRFARPFQLLILRRIASKWTPETVTVISPTELLEVAARVEAGEFQTPPGRSVGMQFLMEIATHSGFLV